MTRRVLLGIAAAAAGLRAELAPARVREMDRLVTAAMSGQHIPGLSIAVLDSAGSVWSNAYGMSDLENFVPVKSYTAFRTASIAKPMTAIAIMQLVERGKVDLDAHVGRYVPSFATRPQNITVRALLGHLGGIRHYRDGAEANSTAHFTSTREALRAFENDELANEPGAKMTYTTYGYVLLGAVVEAASGMTYMEYLRGNILGPAGMTSTAADDPYAVVPYRSRGYIRAPDGSVRNSPLHDTSGKVAGGGLVSTSEDLIRLVQAIEAGKLLKPESLAAMFVSLATADGKKTNYGLGWGIEEKGGRRWVAHGGGQSGVSTLLLYSPASHVALAVMANLQNVNFDFAERAFELLAE